MGRRQTAILEWLLLAALLLAAAWVLWVELRPSRGTGPQVQAHAIDIAAKALPGSGTDMAGVRLAGGLALTSMDPGFGGLSGLAALADGRLLAVSDAGQWLRFRPIVRGGRLVGVAEASTGGLPAPPGGEKYDMDSEAVQVMPNGRLAVSFEQQHRIVIYDGVLPGGALLWLPEYADGGRHRGLFIDAAGRARHVGVIGLPGMAITDAVALDATHVLLLHRRFTGVETAAAISLVDLMALPAATARPLLRWDGSSAWPIDNMEGMALVREAGRPVLYLVSDDNFSAAQRTLLLRLELRTALPESNTPY